MCLSGMASTPLADLKPELPRQMGPVDNLQLPSLLDIQAGGTPTLRHVPLAARHTWNQILTRALATVAHKNDNRAWRELPLLPQCVLRARPRGGKRHSIAKQWRPTPLTGSTACKKGALFFADTPASWAASAFHFFPVLKTDGAWQPWLLSKGLCPDNSDTAQALQALHPQDALPAVPPIHILPVGPPLPPCFPFRDSTGTHWSPGAAPQRCACGWRR